MATTIVLGIVSIGILIFIHEFGHFMMARAVGIRVEVFSIGWGKGIVLFKWKGTKIQLGFIPFGGYCKMAGDSLQDELTGSREEYYSSPPINRILVALGGPLSNYILAFLLFSLIMIIGYQINTYPNRIILANPKDIGMQGETPAQKAGLRDGDIIIGINGSRVRNWDDITENIVRNALKKIKLEVLRDGKKIEVTVTPAIDKSTGRGLIGIYPWVDPVIGGFTAGSPALKAGLMKNDRIVEINGVKIKNQIDFYRILDESIKKGAKRVTLLVERNHKSFTVDVNLKKTPNDPLGLYFKQIKYKSPHYPLYKSIELGFKSSIKATRDTVRGIVLLIGGKIRAKTAIAGPAKIIYISGVIAKEGFVYFLQVMSYISIAFFIMNLIPFPALDGSHIVIALYEMITRKKPNLVVVQRIQAVGFAMLIVLLIFVTFNDITSFIGK